MAMRADHLQRLHRCVDLLGMKLTRPASLYQLNGVLESYRPVKAMLESLTNQRVGRHMVVTLTYMDLYEQLPGYPPQ
jgi:hypothetical protein